ncbi:hypothetical protein [Bosea sp. (in: a-proteobacteria)]|uniref:hypothetical protein n=1 Tax=Bosea sp. (in: a-proteobacteria) TaxID=1871050 RepID=UPI001AC8CBFD|nr:hypothetical protein [Bosea sp. (in: a-proteobacteria)]MBN9437160.1 hypothetical protein [Bosea sp. (in: a-proteobacteria)]
MNYLKSIFVRALEDNIHKLTPSIRNFTYKNAEFAPKHAISPRRYLPDGVDDLLILIEGDDDWSCYIRAAVKNSFCDTGLYRPATNLIIEDYASSNPREPEADVEARAIAWANSL